MKKIIVALALTIALAGCGSDDDATGTPNQNVDFLSYPENNSECLTGVEVSEMQSSVTFEWAAVADAERYFVYVKNLDTQLTLQYNAETATSLAIVLSKGTPYSWYVSANTTAGQSYSSEVWKFYNAGNGITNYAPFPADLVAPAMSSTVSGPTVNLEWATTDLDNDIESHTVYLDTNPNPATEAGSGTAQTLNDVAVTAGATYYWKVITTDAAGNVTTSPVFQFKVQ